MVSVSTTVSLFSHHHIFSPVFYLLPFADSSTLAHSGFLLPSSSHLPCFFGFSFTFFVQLFAMFFVRIPFVKIGVDSLNSSNHFDPLPDSSITMELEDFFLNKVIPQLDLSKSTEYHLMTSIATLLAHSTVPTFFVIVAMVSSITVNLIPSLIPPIF